MSGLFQAFGRFELYYHEQSILENGFERAGYNWARRDGITAPDLPVVNNRLADRYYGGLESNFANGAIANNTGGVYATILDNNTNSKCAMFPGQFKAYKSWFFIDNIIVALGSDISYTYKKQKQSLVNPGNIKEYPIVTTIFQKRVLTADKQFIQNGENVLEGTDKIVNGNKQWFIDPIGTGYVNYGNANLRLIHGEQSSFAPDDDK